MEGRKECDTHVTSMLTVKIKAVQFKMIDKLLTVTDIELIFHIHVPFYFVGRQVKNGNLVFYQ